MNGVNSNLADWGTGWLAYRVGRGAKLPPLDLQTRQAGKPRALGTKGWPEGSVEVVAMAGVVVASGGCRGWG